MVAARSVDIVAKMERRGAITSGMAEAGRSFREKFRLAQLDPLRAVDWSRTRGGTAYSASTPGARIERARDEVWRAVLAVGGINSPGGSCLWHVIGWERSLKDWALEQGWNGRRVSQEAASGILIAMLGVLETHLGSVKGVAQF